MKKTMFISIAFVLCLTVSIGAFAQDFKKHNFGIGVQTDIFSGSRAINNFNPPQSFIDVPFSHIKVFGINVENNAYFGAYFEYQYRINKSFSLSARLGYSYRRVDFRWDVASYQPDGELFLDVNPHDKKKATAVFSDIDIPVFVSYTMPINEHISWTSSLGIGITTTLNISDSNEAKIYDPQSIDDEIPQIDEGLILSEFEVKPYATIQTGLDLTIGKQRLRTYIGYKKQVTKNFEWIYNGSLGQSHSFYQNSIEVGLTFFL